MSLEEVLSQDLNRREESQRRKAEKRAAARDWFLVELQVQNKPSFALGKVNSKHHRSEIVINETLKKQKSKFLQSDENAIYFAFSTILAKDKMQSPEDTDVFYRQFVEPNWNPVYHKTRAREEQFALDFVKRFDSEFFFKDEQNGSFCNRIFNANGSVIKKFAPELADASSIEECTNRVIFHCLQEHCGNVIFLDRFPKLQGSNNAITRKIKEEYAQIDGTGVLVRRNLQKEQTAPQDDQNEILETYAAIVKKYLTNPEKLFIPRNLTFEDFSARTSQLQDALALLENKMADSTTSSPRFKDVKETAETFFANKRVAFDTFGMNEFSSDVFVALEKEKNSKPLTEKDKTALKNFASMVEDLSKIFSTDTNSKQKKLDFFLCTKTQPSVFYDLCCDFENSQFCTKKLETELSSVKKTLTNKDMFTEAVKFEHGTLDVKKSLDKFRSLNVRIVYVDGTEFNLSSEESYEKFKAKLSEIIENNGFPKSESCVMTFAEALVQNKKLTTEKLKA